MAENSSSLKRKLKSPVFKHVIDTRESISEISFSYAPTLVSDGESMKPITRNKLSSSSAASSIGHCTDLFTLIFLRLPPKSLLRFQCVSKQWRLIISDPDFRRLHGRTFHKCCCFSPDSDNLLLYRPFESELNFISLSDENVKPMDSITTGLVSLGFGEISGLHSCNGLLCIDFLLDYAIRQFIVYNPATGHYRSIPYEEIVEKFGCPSDVNICFDPLKSDHYKVVFICDDPDDQAYNFVVYSSETRNWNDSSEVSSMEYADENFYFGNGILCNGNLHWVGYERSILCFDMNKESLNWSVPSLPMFGKEQRRMDCWYFGESEGCLCAIMMNPNQPMLFHVYNLQEGDCSSSSSSSSSSSAVAAWLLKVSINLNPLSISYPSMLAKEYYPRFHFPHFIWSSSNSNHDHKNIGKLVISIARKFILYDISEKTVIELVDVEPVDQNYSWRDMYHWSQTVTFTPTLASV